ncbi:hypothetical protein ASPSYDRAFT_42166 [Aspergillus sydowii CBS 593.65]|uniref:Uncharacterized protein n=1 Tax=Aspergillus sydowii CBS 593.65 TaxID=1036612 RepID=A0A1L9TLY4_9EURO|nr:uncharacterized protein ASPSYDRAFT_42166 [Aspergillus sydowii CBS 593.65]OJJ60440.1 hypothetical protein ASPSYDRAFT_42166 [Aspergillus sydowii CBS 593.65]
MKLLSLLAALAAISTTAAGCIDAGGGCANKPSDCCDGLHCGPASSQNSGTLICK